MATLPCIERTPHSGITRIEVNLTAIAENYRRLSEVVSPTKVMAVLKDNALGHGLVPVAKHLSDAGCRYFALATLSEAQRLRGNGIDGVVLLLRSLAPAELPAAIRDAFQVTIGDIRGLQLANDTARSLNRVAQVQLKIDTGLGRLGLLPDQVPEAIEVLRGLECIELKGVFSHFAVSARRHEFNDLQLRRFLQAAALVRQSQPAVIRHIAASSGTIGMPEAWLDMIRVGGLLYGLSSLGDVPWGLQPALRWIAPLVQVKTVPAGWNVGYGLRYQATVAQRIGVIASGAGDSYPYALRNKASVLVHGRRCRVIGMSLDQCIVDLSAVPEAEVGGEAVLIGEAGEAEIRPEELAELAGTTFGELLSRIPARIPRHYYESGELRLVDC
jgi:alanine racemase